MLRYQNDLAKLPIPDLEDTVEEYLNLVKPIVDEKTYQQTEKKAVDFLHASDAGKRLQKKLEAYEAELNRKEGNKSWLKEFWDQSYLASRVPVVANLNYCGVLESKDFIEKLSPEQTAVLIIEKMVELYRQIASKSMEPEMRRDQPLCMEQYLNTIKTARIPAKDCDQYYWGSSQMANNHIVVMQNDIYTKIMVTDETGKFFSRSQVLGSIIQALKATESRKGLPIGAFTTGERNEAAVFYADLLKHSRNQANLSDLNEALFVICFDPSHEKNQDWLKSLMISNGNNRYFDKSSQFVIAANGEVGFNNEHTGADGTTWFEMLKEVRQHLVENAETAVWWGAGSTQDVPAEAVQEFEWSLSRKDEEAIHAFLFKHEARTKDLFVDSINFMEFGKEEIKKCKISPDAFFHIAVQMAQYRTFGSLRSTYEPVAVRTFRQGRTECTRPVTSSMKALVEAFDPETSKEQLCELVHQAAAAHINRIKRCQNGRGVERHLLGLQLMIDEADEKQESIAGFFEDEAYKRLKHDFISTSGLGYESIRYFAFAPVVEDGFGIGYAVLPYKISVTVSCYKNNAAQLKPFVSALRQSFIDLLQALN